MSDEKQDQLTVTSEHAAQGFVISVQCAHDIQEEMEVNGRQLLWCRNCGALKFDSDEWDIPLAARRAR